MTDIPPDETQGPTDRQVGLREVILLGLGAVAVVLGAAVVTALLPPDVQALVFRTPLIIAVLIGGTALALWYVVRAR
jgi:hypothetical protein